MLRVRTSPSFQLLVHHQSQRRVMVLHQLLTYRWHLCYLSQARKLKFLHLYLNNFSPVLSPPLKAAHQPQPSQPRREGTSYPRWFPMSSLSVHSKEALIHQPVHQTRSQSQSGAEPQSDRASDLMELLEKSGQPGFGLKTEEVAGPPRTSVLTLQSDLNFVWREVGLLVFTNGACSDRNHMNLMITWSHQN